jgi:hypothetical protein
MRWRLSCVNFGRCVIATKRNACCVIHLWVFAIDADGEERVIETIATREAEGRGAFVDLVLGAGDDGGDGEQAGGVEAGDLGLPCSGEHVGDLAEAVDDGIVDGGDLDASHAGGHLHRGFGGDENGVSSAERSCEADDGGEGNKVGFGGDVFGDADRNAEHEAEDLFDALIEGYGVGDG